MTEVGIRELKSRLSYYVQLMQTGETVAIKVRNQVVGFLSKLQPFSQATNPKRHSRSDINKLMKQWEKEGFLAKGYNPHARMTPFRPVRFKGGKTSTQIIREMRDEDL